MNKHCLLVAALVLLMLSSFAQNVGINADGARPNPNAILDIKSVNKGLLIPRMDSFSRKAIPNTKGLLVYDISSDNFWYNTGKEWKCIPNDKDKGGNAWLLTGNANTKDGVDFLGTTNNVPLNIRVNNQPSGRIDSASGNTSWGYQSIFSVQPTSNTGINNTAVGYQTLYSTSTGETNTAIGFQSMFSNITGYANAAVGISSLYGNTTGYYNTAIGAAALFINSTGFENTATGHQALSANSTGFGNTASGSTALLSNSSGNDNTATGYSSLYNSKGGGNTANGALSLFSTTTGSFNTASGEMALSSNTSGSYNTATGYLADVSNGLLTNATAIGNGAVVDASNKVRIGNAAVTVIEGQVPFTTPSDGRYKFNVREDVKGLDFIMHIRPVTYQFDAKRFDAGLRQGSSKAALANYTVQTAYDEASRIRRSGFIAQEVEQAANTSGYDFSGIIKPKTDEDHYSLSYDAFVVPLVKAVQEQQQIIQQQNKKLETQDKKLVDLQAQLDQLKKLLQPTN
jgi:hypothetical protein